MFQKSCETVGELSPLCRDSATTVAGHKQGNGSEQWGGRGGGGGGEARWRGSEQVQWWSMFSDVGKPPTHPTLRSTFPTLWIYFVVVGVGVGCVKHIEELN